MDYPIVRLIMAIGNLPREIALLILGLLPVRRRLTVSDDSSTLSGLIYGSLNVRSEELLLAMRRLPPYARRAQREVNYRNFRILP